MVKDARETGPQGVSVQPNSFPSSAPNIADVHVVRGVAAAPDAAPDLLIEVPHGATATADFDLFSAELEGPHPAGLVDFFHVNTDVGAFEVAVATAELLVASVSDRTILVVRSRIPRTFIDCNRRIDADPEEFKTGGVTPGVMPWVRSAADRALLRSRYDSYQATVRAAIAALQPDAATLLLHTYAPRTVGVEVDEKIVESLRRAYQHDVIETWPLRPELDVIARDIEGRSHAPLDVVGRLHAAVADLGWAVGDSVAYPMHPSATAWDHVVARPGRVLCLEVRRDLLADPFDPFVEMRISPSKVAQVASPLAASINDWGTNRGRL